MRRIIVTLAVAVVMLLGLGTAAYANSNTCGGTECIIYYGSSHGWNDWNGNTNNGASIKYYQSLSAENSEFDETIVSPGRVCNGETGSPCNGAAEPFTVGSGLNARYDGQPIYEFATDNKTTQCVSASTYSPSSGYGDLELQGCDGLADQWFVLSSTFFMAPVDANNNEYAINGTAHLPVLVGDDNSGCNVGNGQLVTVTSSGLCQLQYSIVNSS